jgi:monoterpene epsilon-lactone hydrolase
MSLQARIAKVLFRLQLSGWSQGTIEEQRAKNARFTESFRLPGDVRCQQISADDVAAEWIEAPGAESGVILYLHGGCYALGSVDTHREFVARLARATRMRALGIDYRLAPEHPFPAALEDATAAYGWLLAQGIDPSRVIFAGDSAGGGLALATLVALRDAGRPLPAGAVCLSPWTDLALTGASIQTKAQVDLVLGREGIEKYTRYYAGEHHQVTHPLISPLYADLKGLPPLLVLVGTEEILLDDATRCAENAREAGVDVTLEIWDEMFHNFPLAPFLPEAKRAVGQMAEFVSRVVQRSELS